MENEKNQYIDRLKDLPLEKLKELIELNGAIQISEVKPVTPGELLNPPEPSLLDKAKSFAKSYISRGLTNKKAENITKSLRILSCHGDEMLQPCPFRNKSKNFEDSYYCGICGCGDKESTQLVNLKNENGTDKYSKLDFPKVYCPMTMPGFSNYEPQDRDAQASQNFRKLAIEDIHGVDFIVKNSNLDNGVQNEQDSNNNENK
jgi:hypothetical protein